MLTNAEHDDRHVRLLVEAVRKFLWSRGAEEEKELRRRFEPFRERNDGQTANKGD